MSHFTTIRTQIRDRAILIQVLQELGFSTIEVHETPQPLYGYEGEQRPETAEIIIRRQYISEFSNDLGFQLQADGTYTAIISDYDRTQYNQAWLGKLLQKYSYYKLQQLLQQQGLQLQSTETLADGTIRVVVA
ncbi:MAG: DUF1257 domain-containing protein [Pseudanabaenaceae cyanobacterium]